VAVSPTIAPAVRTLHVLVAAALSRPGVEQVLLDAESEARAGARVEVLFTDDGLATLQSPWPARLVAVGAKTSLCARSARARKMNPLAIPATVRWSSLTVFVSGVAEGACLWTAFP
jgi:hypothetical protein